MITAIDPQAVKKSGKPVSTASAQEDFSVFMGAMAPAGYEAGVQVAENYNAAAVTHAAMTGLSGATAPYNGGYLGITSGGAGGYYSPGAFRLGDSTPAIGAGGTTGGVTPTGGLPVENPSQDFIEKEFLLRQMFDSSMSMLVLQSQVQEQSRNFTLVSNVLQSRDRTLHTMIQNMRGA